VNTEEKLSRFVCLEKEKRDLWDGKTGQPLVPKVKTQFYVNRMGIPVPSGAVVRK